MIGQIKFNIKYFALEATPFTMAWGINVRTKIEDVCIRNLQIHEISGQYISWGKLH